MLTTIILISLKRQRFVSSILNGAAVDAQYVTLTGLHARLRDQLSTPSEQQTKKHKSRSYKSKEVQTLVSTVDTSCHSVSRLPFLLFNINIVTTYKNISLLDLEICRRELSCTWKRVSPTMINIVEKIPYHLLRSINFQHL